MAMANGVLSLLSLAGMRVVVSGVFLGNVSNRQTTTLDGEFTIQGFPVAELTLEVPGSVGPATLTAGALNINGKAAYTVQIPQGAAPGTHQATLKVRRLGEHIGNLVFTLGILDLDKSTVEALTPPSPKGSVLELLQVTQEDFIVL